MVPLDETLDTLQRRDDCAFEATAGLPTLPSGLLLPPDLMSFYRRFGGGRMFGPRSDPRYTIPAPSAFVPIGIAIFGAPITKPPQDAWYTLADVMDGNYIAIDCHPARLGLCYDVFHETAHDLRYCTVIARSFTEFMHRAAACGNEAWWLGDRFPMHGSAAELPLA